MKKLATPFLSPLHSARVFLLVLIVLFQTSALGVSNYDPPTDPLSLQQQITDNPSTQLSFGRHKCKKLALKHADRYEFEVSEGSGIGYVYIDVMQKGIDITLVLSGPEILR